MRHKDENKSEAIFQATVELLNEIGFSDISMSKIAKRASVSSATIYVYFENKEDMLGKLYVKVKHRLSRSIINGFDSSLSTKAACELFMRNTLKFMLDNKQEFLFLEQFSTSPLISKLKLEDTSPLFEPLYAFIEKGKRDGELKQIGMLILLSYCYFPIAQLALAHFKGQAEANEEHLGQIIRMSWDAIRA
ncbi:TetR/AcrR family transcriptional regulator [Cohnella endophytica]|uniref:TetR/AcrR family transcriptional regulator n=1 Tax=Cohnella endophytica TaxID=2419778 RepID=A0A494Y3K1_9BACL|nr:TetR/AcrR family transcriptional regulator [Cohnella endophytica]RKP55061.1 TetR/AcrR family transcriptional regulator [Cohnella endophytica]